MKFIKNLYIGDKIKNKDRIIRRLSKNHPYKNLYCICLDSSSNNLLVILNSSEIKKDINRNKDYKIIGIAMGKEEAFELTRRIIDSVYKEYGDPIKIREFFA
ncbi:MAG TPA: hypothetical protein PKK61_01495 [Defluviitaleaceae bacterium]|mgnify:CR=1 FL=1|nr:hypothetical protein [Candidatus Epulonipiscium sp.]HOA79726.1 hypothetical protein [Defluviitaleaceae bacterium]